MTIWPAEEISAPTIAKYVRSYLFEHLTSLRATISPHWKIAGSATAVQKCVGVLLMELPTGNNLPVETFGTYRYDSTPAITRMGGTDAGDNLAPDDLARCWSDEFEFCC